MVFSTGEMAANSVTLAKEGISCILLEKGGGVRGGVRGSYIPGGRGKLGLPRRLLATTVTIHTKPQLMSKFHVDRVSLNEHLNSGRRVGRGHMTLTLHTQ